MKINKKRKKLRVVNTNSFVSEKSSDTDENKSRDLKIKIIVFLGLICAAILAIYLFNVYRSYGDYKVIATTKIESGTNSQYQAFGDFIVKYSNDGISYMNDGGTVWNEAYEMKAPITDICGNYLAIADKGTNTIYIFNKEGKVGIVTTSYPIVKLEVASQGVVAALLEEAKANYIELYDKEGNVLVSHKALLNEDGFPLAFSISNNGEKMITSYLSISNGNTANKILFYNFSDVGQDEVDRKVGIFDQYGKTIIPAVYFLTNDDAVAVGDNVLSIYKMKETPNLKKDISIEGQIQKIFYNSKNIGILVTNEEGGSPYKIEVYNLNGTKVMSYELNKVYEKVRFSGENILLYDALNMKVVSFKGVKKCEFTFKKKINEIIPMENRDTYLLIKKNDIQEIKLK